MNAVRTGLGWDNHRIAEGRPLIIGGIAIASPFGLDGHSDADVLLHAVTDALLGALALGDIGMHFPDSDARWKGASSDRFAMHAAGQVRERGWTIANIDATVILERPKLNEFRGAIRENVARLLNLDPDCVSVKFKTSEKVGPVGEGKSAEAQAIVTLIRS